jgi:hypothetical protein
MMLRHAQKRRLSSPSTVASREEVLLELLEDSAVTMQRCKWELQSKSVYDRQMSERDEIEAYMHRWHKESVGDQIGTILTNPTAVLSNEHCPSLRGTVRALTTGPYKKRKLRTSTNNEDCKGKVDAEKFERRYNLQVAALLNHIIRVKNVHYVPPLMLQRGLERLYYGTSKSDWRQQQRERLIPSLHYIEKGLESVKGWRPEPPFEVSKQFALVVHDNLEWHLLFKHQHHTKDSKASDELNTSKPFVHTTTSEYGLHVLRVQPDSVCRLLLGYS